MSYAFSKKDKNHKEIVDALVEIPGVSVFETHRIGGGFPDIVVGFRGETYLVEIKSANGKLTGPERDFFDNWTGHVTIGRTLDDILDAIGAI